MTAPIIPPRRWSGDPEPERPKPTVIVSSRDGAPVPVVPGAARLMAAAEAAGWTARQTYALADVPATSRRDAHRLASVAVWLASGSAHGWAVWYRIDDGPWRFANAHLSMRRVGIRELMAAL